MSRIGKAHINIPEKVEVKIQGTQITVKGPKGELKQTVDEGFKITVSENELSIERPSESKEHKSKHGLYRSLINNCIVGVSEGYTIQQEFVGVGYRVAVNGQNIEMALGFSHPIVFQLPKEVSAEAKSERGSNPLLTLTSIDKQLIGQVAAKIRSLRKPEPYKGKGIRFKGEQLRRKAGKSAGK
ncbi:MAG: 50S ribosomal protein L6 [Bacteroidales bacterium]|jgi:large subunit ribosomal protein L6|nr:50S ribosomal protein L6 [Bacteroidales bacterium]NLK81056.1 50S ribosomal protein L6 [Bacteroidales bacterium]